MQAPHDPAGSCKDIDSQASSSGLSTVACLGVSGPSWDPQRLPDNKSPPTETDFPKATLHSSNSNSKLSATFLALSLPREPLSPWHLAGVQLPGHSSPETSRQTPAAQAAFHQGWALGATQSSQALACEGRTGPQNQRCHLPDGVVKIDVVHGGCDTGAACMPLRWQWEKRDRC